MCSLFKDIICNTFPLFDDMMKSSTACPFSITTPGNIYQGFESILHTGPPLHVPPTKQNKVPNKVHQWKIACKARINNVHCLSDRPFPFTLTRNWKINRVGRSREVFFFFFFPASKCWVIITQHIDSDKEGGNNPTSSHLSTRRSCSCSARPVGAAPLLHLAHPAVQPLARIVWVRNCRRPITAEVGGYPLLLQIVEGVCTDLPLCCTYEPPR